MYYLIKTTNNLDGVEYYGIINNLEGENRWGDSIVIKRAINVYKKENFSREILFQDENLEIVTERLNSIKKEKRLMYSPNYYNVPENEEEIAEYKKYLHDLKCEAIRQKRLSNGALYKSEEFRKKMSEVTKGEKNGMYGKRHSADSIERMSETRKRNNQLRKEKQGNV